MNIHRSSSLVSQQAFENEEDSLTFKQSQIILRIMSSKHTMLAKTFNSFGIPLKSNGSKATTVIAIQETRKHEQYDMNYLNNRFASYVERVRFLEGQNRKLQLEIEQLRSQWTSQKNRMKDMFEVEIHEAHHIIDETEKDRIQADLRARHAEEEVLRLKDTYTSLVGKGSDRRKIDQLQKQISDNEADINLFHRRLHDLEEEQNRYRITSHNLISDIQQITKELDNEIITRIQLENQKEKLEEEIELLKRLHAQKIEQIKQMSLRNVSIDPTNLFEYQLSNAIKSIRTEYDHRNYQLRDELESWYQWKVSQAIQDLQSYQTIEYSENLRNQDEYQKLQYLIAESRQDMVTMRQRNGNIENRIQELERLIHVERDGQTRATDEHQRQIRDLRARLNELDQDYNELITTKSSLHSEIDGYQKLLDRGDLSKSLSKISTKVQEQASTNLYSDRSNTKLYPQYYQKASSEHVLGKNYRILTPYVPFKSVASTQTESTIFDQVYGNYRRPVTISFHLPAMSIVEQSWSQQWNGNDINTRHLKTRPRFEMNRGRGYRQRKSITPPSSDYTDAYLSVFAPKQIPRRSAYRLTTPIFTNVAPLPFVSKRTDFSKDNEFQTSQTRFNPISNSLSWNSFDKIKSDPVHSTSAPSSNFLSNISTHYQSVSSQYSPSIENQLSNANDSPSKETTYVQSQLSPSVYPITDRSSSPYENIDQSRLPADIISSIPSQQSMPLSSIHDVNQDDASIEKFEKSEILLLQPEENIDSSDIEQPSSIIMPPDESLITPIDTKTELERSSSVENLSIAAVKPIEILENTITKYDTLINQISDILASVTPITSKLSNMNPNKSTLDNELSSDSSLTHQREHTKAHKLPEPIKKPCIQRANRKDMIRGDSYSKLFTAITDLDKEMTPPMDVSKASSIEQIKEETERELFDEDPTLTTLLNNNKQATKIELVGEQQFSTTDEPTNIDNEISGNENNVIESETKLIIDVSNNDIITQETDSFYDDNNVGQHETVANNDDNECLSYQSLKEEEEEYSTLELAAHVIETSVAHDQQVIPDQSITAEIIPNEPQTLLSSTADVQFLQPKTQAKFLARQLKSISSLEVSSSSSEYADRRTTSLDSNDFQVSQEEPLNDTKNSSNLQFLSPTDSFEKDTLPVEEHVNTTSTVVNEENSIQSSAETELNKSDITKQLVDNIGNETIVASPALVKVVSPIDRLSDLISNRYTSSDVYHGYLGEYIQFKENLREMSPDHVQQTVLLSLRQTISTPIMPHLETVSSNVTNMQIMTPMESITIESKEKDDHQTQTGLKTISMTDSTEELEKFSIQPNRMLKDNIVETQEIIQNPVKFEPILENLSADKQEILVTLTAEKPMSIEDLKKPPTPPVNKIEPIQLFSFESMQDVDSIETPSSTVPILLPVDKLSTASVIPSTHTDSINTLETTNMDSVSSKVIEDDMHTSVDTSSTSTSPVIQTVTQIFETSIVSNEEISEIQSSLNEMMDVSIADEKMDEIKSFVDDTTSSFVTVDETISSAATSSPCSSIIEDQPAIKQDSEPINNQTNIGQTTSAEFIQNQSSPSNENHQVIISDKLESFTMEERMSSITTSSKDLSEKNTMQIPSSVIDTVIFEKIDVLPTPKTNALTLALEHQQESSENVVHVLMDNIAQIVSSQLESSTATTPDHALAESLPLETNDDVLQLVSTANKDGTILPKLTADLRAISPENTEPNSFELIHALRGHSIASPISLDQHFLPPEKSSSSTTSSPITSSDRYVSYAIHQMNDSSQDRLPIIPIAEDMPDYANREEKVLLEPLLVVHRSALKEDDLTEFDATDNLTSYSDDILYRRLYRSSPDRRNHLDTSSTDDDVDEEFEEHDLTNIHRISDKATDTSSSISTNEGRYHRYDRVTTPSTHESSLSPAKQQPDDIYLIPGYPGLWRTTTTTGAADNGDENSPIDYDADDETKAIIKTRIAAPVSDSLRRPLSFQAHRDQTTSHLPTEILTTGIPLRSEILDVFNQPVNDLTFDISEADSYQTCPSSIARPPKPIELNENKKPLEKIHSSPEESIFLICERERGVSLPITMNIDYDDIAFRLSTSTPNDAQLCSSIATDFSSALPSKSTPPIQASTPSLNNPQKSTTWLNNVNTVTTTTEGSDGPLQSRVTFQKSAKGPISISECHSQGHYIIVDNTSQSKNIDLTNWIICQENNTGEKILFTFPEYCLLKPNHSIKIFSKTYKSEQRNDDDLIATSVSTWHTGSQIVTTLINPDGKERATLTKKTISP
ncbi:hypothetical protein I4U23_025842 [Adineta vaga]|nr:hypothetical protein I4U23_025842 [Adineta vaga]